MDLPVDNWAPDVLRNNDRLIDRDKLLKRTEERLESKNVDVASEIEMPKTPFFARTGHMLSLEDRITCHATVGTFATKIESCLSGTVVFSTRLAPPKSRQLTLKGVKQSKRQLRLATVADQVGPGGLLRLHPA